MSVERWLTVEGSATCGALCGGILGRLGRELVEAIPTQGKAQVFVGIAHGALLPFTVGDDRCQVVGCHGGRGTELVGQFFDGSLFMRGKVQRVTCGEDGCDRSTKVGK